MLHFYVTTINKISLKNEVLYAHILTKQLLLLSIFLTIHDLGSTCQPTQAIVLNV